MACPVIATERLLLREWRDPDVEAFIVMNADPVVMRFFPETYSRERTRRFVARIRECWAERGYG
ncbi:MAG: GNAT family N-acetyltransferase, partial [Chloroflexi bacterium]